jgi:plasmid stabilization system protein ParE
MAGRVFFAPEAEAQLIEILRYIAGRGDPDNALAFTQTIIDYCESLADLPQRGTRRDYIRPGALHGRN